jgi:hypothetical protein
MISPGFSKLMPSPAKALICLVLFVLTFLNHIAAQTELLPTTIQASLFIKVLKFNTKLSEKQQINMLIVYNNGTRREKEELFSELTHRKIKVKAVLLSELEENIKSIDAVYFMPGLQDKNGICKANKVLTFTGVSKYVEEGNASIAFALLNDKPKILINVTSLKNEDQNISSELLRIAKVYK